MTQVKIVYVPDAARRGPDLNRIGRIEDIDPDVARRMVQEGTATIPTPDDFAAAERVAAQEREVAAQATEERRRAAEQTKRPKRAAVADEAESSTN